MIELFQSPIAQILLVVVVVALVVLFIVLLARSRRRQPAEPPPEEAVDAEPAELDEEVFEPSTPESEVSLRKSFADARWQLRRHSAGRKARYEIPWFLLLGGVDSRPPDLLADLGLGLPFGPPESALPAAGTGCNWWFFDRAVVLDVGGAYVLRDGGRAGDDKGWKTLLGLLQKHRPQRPVDGVVLTISCRELLEAKQRGSDGVADIERRGTRLYSRLADVQRKLGIRYPLYVLVTGCDSLPGFDAFCEALPERLQDDIFGWSSPYAIETSFRDVWTDEAFRQMAGRLDQARLEILAEHPEMIDADQLYLFPNAVQALREPLRVYLAHLVNANAYLGSMLLRGIYFCGSAPAAAARSLPTSATGFYDYQTSPFEDGTHELYWQDDVLMDRRIDARGTGNGYGNRFLKRLLEYKVFPEASLGMPTRGTVAARNRTVRIAQLVLLVLAVILVLGTVGAYRTLKGRQAEMSRFLKATAEDLREHQQYESSDNEIRSRALGLVRRMAELDAGWFGSPYLPSSWLSGFNTRLESSFREAFRKIIFQAMSDALQQRTEMLVSRPQTDSRNGRREIVAIEQMEEFKELDQFVGGLATLEEHYRLYNDLGRSQKLEDLGRVIQYLFEETRLPERFYRQADLYRAVLRNDDQAPFEPSELDRERAQATLRTLADRFFRHLFVESLLKRDFEKVAEELQGFGQSERNRDVARQAERIRQLVESINRLEGALSRPETEWAFRSTFDLGNDFEGLMTQVQRSAFFGETAGQRKLIADGLRDEARSGWQAFREDLRQYQTLTRRPVLRIDEETRQVRAELSLEVLRIQEALRSLQTFTRLDETHGLEVEIPPNTSWMWDSSYLTEALELRTSYQRFEEDILHQFKGEGDASERQIHSALTTVAQTAVSAKIINLVGRAQRPQLFAVTSSRSLEDQIVKEFDRFEAAKQPLTEIRDQLIGLSAEARRQLERVIANQSSGLLGKVDRLLEEMRLYQPLSNALENWHGESPSSFGAFDVYDEDGLARYLQGQRQQLLALVEQYGKALVDAISEITSQLDSEQRARFDKWSEIVKQLEDYQRQQAGNSVTKLEKVIQEQLPASLDDCLGMERWSADDTSRDFYLEQVKRLRAAIDGRCQELAGARAENGYREIAGHFNRWLAGRFPFSPIGKDIFDAEIKPEDLRSFFGLYDRHRAFLELLPSKTPAGVDVRGFIEEIDEVRAFFSHFLDSTEKDIVPVFEVDVEFRVNRENERHADQVIGWDFAVASTRIGFRDSERVTRWRPGQPVRLALRWAKDSPYLPVDEGLSDGSGDPRILYYEHANRWSLLSFLIAYRGSSQYLGRLADDKPHTLMFRIPTRARDALPSQNDDSPTAQVFVRLKLQAPDTNEPLILPRFPEEAPALPRR